MPIRHRLLAGLVAVLWGLNFLAIHASLQQFPPYFLVALRWTLIAVPTVLLVPRPQVPTRYLIGYGVGFGVLQFAFLYSAMDAGMPTGLASLVLQSSAPFTVLLGVLVGERLTRTRALGVIVAVIGLVIVGSQRVGGAAWWPFVLTLCAGFGWAIGNLSSKLAHPPKPLHLTLWMTVVPPLPMLGLALLLEGPQRIADSVTSSGSAWGAWSGLLYTCVLGSVAGSGIWTWLMTRHPASTVAPYSMLVPVVGLSAAWIALGERPSPVELVGCVVVVAGVLLTSRTPAPPIVRAVAIDPGEDAAHREGTTASAVLHQ
ncbi:membrane protein [Flexivirga endophytica]|uniref:Membrane protein n=1 Tax=Flexivirga endophytica TaxID=1849103 RepID=A0A916X011_9MICO|nr:EamA family transporter [Flexivirga endophytica]GGB42765.1 membrane protein [Flexivirga endophytica]GHB64263.1 membrane protein [Flexivirga endophytica]